MTNTVETIKDILSELLRELGISFSEISVTEDGNILRANIETEEAPLLIGWRGTHLDALQQILKSLLWKKGLSEDLFIIVDVNEYKKVNEEKLITMAQEKAEMVVSTKISQMMPPLSAVDRRLIHLEISKNQYPGVATESVEGEDGDLMKRVKIFWKG
ncbi:MAG: hypothetical protein WCJ84_01300 [Candidatus Peregrinibacteria bacterium]